MSEVKNPILAYADQYRTEAGRGQKLADIWSVVTDLERNIAPLWDAQRLRADKAEAELAKLRERHDAVKCQRNDAAKGLAAAEQRIALMSKLLKRCIPVCRFKNSHTERDLIADINAALNPKPEAESHDRIPD